MSDGGQYYLFTTNTENGCATLDSILVVQDTLLPISEAGMPMTLTCVDTVITLDGTASSTGIEFSYQWISNDGNLLSGENTLTPQVDEMGIYQLETTNLNNQCTSMDVVEILENTTPPTAEINAIGGLILNCDVSSIVLDASSSSPFGNITFEWMTNNGNILSGQNAENPEVDLLGDYFLTITDVVNGCTTSEMVTITANFEAPIATILTPEILTCKDTVITLDGTGSSEGNEFSYLWTTTNGNIVSGQNNLTCGVNASGDYVLTILNTTNGCSSTATITVLQDVSVPFADAGGDYEFDCVQTELQLDAMASQGTEFSYEWTTQNGNVLLGENTLQPTVDEFGTYLLTVTNQENGCVANSSTLVTEDLDTPQEVLVNIIPPLCFGDFNASIEITGVIGGDAPYVFSFNQFSFSSTTNFSSLSAGVYSVTVKDASGCELTTEIIIENPEELQVELGDDLFLELGESSNLEALTNVPTNELDSVIWVTSDIFDCPTCLQQEIAPLRGTVYSVILINENGCVAEDALRVFVNNKKRIYIPNAFSPNGDGWNDEFMIFGGNGIAEIEQFQIFTRWGEQVFEQSNFQPNDANMGWDGFFKGKKMNPAVFVYFAKVKYLNGETEVFKGDLFLK